MLDLGNGEEGDPKSIKHLAETQFFVSQLALAELYGRPATPSGRRGCTTIHSAAFGLTAEWNPSLPSDAKDAPSRPSWRICARRLLAQGEIIERCHLLDLGPLSGMMPAGDSALAKACVWLQRSGQPPSAMLPMGFGALYRRAAAGEPAPAAARWAEGGKQLVLTANVEIEPGEEIVLPADLCDFLLEQRVADDATSDTSGPDAGDCAADVPAAAIVSQEEEQEDWDAIEAALQEQEDDEESSEEVGGEQSACMATEDWFREYARSQQAAQEARARQPVWAMEPAPGELRLLPPAAGVAAGAVRAGRSRVHGLGVFALVDFAPESVVEVCPGLTLDKDGRVALADYAMSFEAKGDNSVSSDGLPRRLSVVALGCGALYNHREVPNVAWCYLRDVAEGVVAMVALRQVFAGEELFISYGAGYWQGRSAPDLVAACNRASLMG